MRKLVLLVAAVAALVFVPSAAAVPPTDVLDGDVTCGVVDNAGTGEGAVGGSVGQTWCGTLRASDNINATTVPALPTQLPVPDGQPQNPPVSSTAETFDEVPIDVNVAFPDEADHGEGPYPMVMMFHGYGGSKMNFRAMQRWLNRGYAVFSQTNRGFHESCGRGALRTPGSICQEEGFVRLNDTRYEVRDAQTFAGLLVDEGLVEPDRIAASGGSYGGGMSMALAALRDRIMLPDSTYDDWESPSGTPISLAVAIPNIPWTDLAYSLVPNGSTLDYLRDSPYSGRFGVMKQSYVNGLYLGGLTAPGYYTPAGTQPDADLAGWKAFMDAGEPYDGTPEAEAMIEEITQHHSSYYIDHSQAPAPLLISSGFTDDLFPVDEATRFYNRTRAEFPDSPLGLFFGSFGHMRGQNKPAVNQALTELENQWVDYYLADEGNAPDSNVTAYTQTCPDNAPADGPYVSSDWSSASPGEIRVVDRSPAQVVRPDGGDRAVGALFNPAPSGKACTEAPGAKEPGTANYETDPAPAGGYTVLGAPTVTAYIKQAGSNSQLAARLVDVSPDNTKLLVNRGLWRPEGAGYQVFQLHANGWKVEEGHVLRLEILPFDGGQANPAEGTLANYGRPSNGQQPAAIANVDLRIPVRDAPGSAGGMVEAPAPKVLPDRPGAQLAPGYSAIGSISIADYADEAGNPDLTCPPGTVGTGQPDCAPPVPCPPGTTGTNEPDCVPDVCPAGTNGTPPNCVPDAVVGNVSVIGNPTVKGRKLTVKVRCKIGNDRCKWTNIKFRGAPKKGKKGKGLLIAKGKARVVKSGGTKKVKFKLTGKARKFFKDRKVRRKGKKKIRRGPNSLRARAIVAGKNQRFVKVKRVGRVR
jgi:hypothetical protein